MKKSYNVSSLLLIQMVIGVYFSLSGLLGIMGFNSGANQFFNSFNKLLGKSNYLPLIISIVFMLAGIILIFGVILNFKNKFLYLVILILWVIYIVMNNFTDNFLKPDVLMWSKDLSLNLVILAGLWGSSQR